MTGGDIVITGPAHFLSDPVQAHEIRYPHVMSVVSDGMSRRKTFCANGSLTAASNPRRPPRRGRINATLFNERASAGVHARGRAGREAPRGASLACDGTRMRSVSALTGR